METELTLRQGLAKFHDQYTDHLSHDKPGISSEALQFFESHDIAHVLFNCNISLQGEGAVKLWTIFGTTLGFKKHIIAYRVASAYDLSKQFTLFDIIQDLPKFLISIPTIIVRAKRMSKPWDWTGFHDYLDRPLSEIRKEFNIRVL